MAPRVPNIIQEMRDYFQGDPIEEFEEDNDEYLDRLGVSDEDKADEIPAVPPFTESEEIRNPRTHTPATSSEHYADALEAAGRLDRGRFEQEYMSYFDRNFESPNITRRADQEMMAWSNGDYEPRPRRRMPHRNRFDGDIMRARTSTSDYVHEQVDRQRVRMLEVIIRDTEHLVYDFLDRMSGAMDTREGENMLLAMVDHFLEDVGKDLMIRHRVVIRQDHASFATWMHIEIEFPNMNPMRVSIDLNGEMNRLRNYHR